MALRVIRLFIPSRTVVFKAGSTVQTSGIHTGIPRNLSYGWLAYILGERTLPRFKQNSKIISIDGNLASGKGSIAQKISEKLGMLYMPEADVNYLHKMTGETGEIHEKFKGNCSLEKFYTEPLAPDGNSYRLQAWMYLMRMLQYSDAVEHLLTTGQGVILERSPFSDFVFLEAMYRQGYIRKECVDHYNEIKSVSLCEFVPPHLVIYIDKPAEEVQKELKQSGERYLQNVPLPYLKAIEDTYKNVYLPHISEYSEVLSYDPKQALDIERVVEDIEYLPFDKKAWADQTNVSLHHMRLLVQDKTSVASLTCIPRYLPEITIGAHESSEIYHAFKALPGKMYAPGYNADAGDRHIWLK